MKRTKSKRRNSIYAGSEYTHLRGFWKKSSTLVPFFSISATMMEMKMMEEKIRNLVSLDYRYGNVFFFLCILAVLSGVDWVDFVRF